MFTNYFQNEIENPNTNYFILDTHGKDQIWDIDFIKYSWQTHFFNKIKCGDLFIYRRPKRSSENGMFYFFGAGKIGQINSTQLDRNSVEAEIEKPYPFNEYLYQNELDNFSWHFKKRKKTWSHFFNQYGMNQIARTDFINLLKLSEQNYLNLQDLSISEELTAINKIQSKNYFSEDSNALTKKRNGHNAFSNEVKKLYSNKCAICSLSTKDFLVASHIVPWSKDKNNRLNPSNGICLCSFHDQAFDKGFISIDDNYKIIITQKKIEDSILLYKLQQINQHKIKLPKVQKPDKNFLKFHRENILIK